MTSPKIRIRPNINFNPVVLKGSIAYVIDDSAQQKFWRVGPLEHEICSAINGNRTMPEVLQFLQHSSALAKAAGMEKVQKVTLWLLHSGFVEEVCSDNKAATKTNTNSGTGAKPTAIFDPSSFKVPLFNSEQVDHFSRQFVWLISWPCLLLAACLWAVAVSMMLQNNEAIWNLGQKLFVPGSQWWWLTAWLILKAIHEAGHAIACARTGAPTKGAGLGFIFFTPMPYVDVSNLWQVENKWSRALVSAAGMLFEITFAAIAMIIACSVENSTIRFLCFAIATLGTFTTLAFNGNPLMRFDGYYILVDMIGRPNLWQDASKALKAHFGTWIFKNQNKTSCSFLILAYGFASLCSRILVLLTMGWGIWMTWNGIGLLIIAFFVCLWFVIPWARRTQMSSRMPFAKGPTLLQAVCPKKVVRNLGLVTLLALCSFLPSPFQIYWPAVVDYTDPRDVRTIAPGFVESVLVHDGQGVNEGDEIIILRNPTLELEFEAAKSLVKSSEEKCNALRAQKKHSELQAEETNHASLTIKYQLLETKMNSLVLRAPRNGVLLARNSHNLPGSYLTEGHAIGVIVDPSQLEVKASVPQYAWSIVTNHVNSAVTVFLLHNQVLKGTIAETLPRTSEVLDSPCLGGIHGGPIPVVVRKDAKGEDQIIAQTPRLQTRVMLNRDSAYVAPPPGSLCCIKLTNYNEAIWQTGYRWIQSAIHVQFNKQSEANEG